MGEDAAGAPRGKGSVSADFEGADWGDGGSGWADGEDEWGDAGNFGTPAPAPAPAPTPAAAPAPAPAPAEDADWGAGFDDVPSDGFAADFVTTAPAPTPAPGTAPALALPLVKGFASSFDGAGDDDSFAALDAAPSPPPALSSPNWPPPSRSVAYPAYSSYFSYSSYNL